MRTLRLVFLLYFLFSSLYAQTYCDSVFQVVPGSIEFKVSQFSGGDSMLQLSLANISSAQSLAYPTAKIVMLSSLPPGMTLANSSLGFNTVFASSYNPLDTNPVYFYFNVTQAIPDNYTVWFQLWVDGDNSATAIDSCIALDSFLVNLKPVVPLSYEPFSDVSSVIQLKQDANSYFVRIPGYFGGLTIYDLTGKHIVSQSVKGEDWVALDKLPAGICIFRLDSGQAVRFIISQ